MINVKRYRKNINSNSKKIGIDIHGVINTNPDIFSPLTKELKRLGYEIHILTGPRLNHPYKTKRGDFKNVKKELDTYDITYDYLFSVLDYNIENDKDVWKNEKGWWTDEKSWNSTKGEYSRDHNLDLHIDDTKIYGSYFNTPFAHLTPPTGSPRVLEYYGISEDNEILKLIEKFSKGVIYTKKMD